ncbi:MAG: T9SS type A sorting domain-containing protein [Dysgonamonadaceae bacterium]|jgi:hypothetical protein|nr:T9SS type A sorting domain-containing protein [Dysgonamonadaceae bacterium]
MKTINLLKTVLLGTIFTISCLGVSAQTTYYWDFGTATTLNATPAGTDANLTVSDITIGNTLGTISGGFVTTTSASSGYTGASGGGNAGNAARTGALNIGATGSAYFEFTVTPAVGYKFSFSSISFGTRSTNTGPAAYSLCSSVDSYATEITSGTITVSGNPWALKSNPGLTFESESAVTFRIYGHSGSGSAANNTINWKIDDLSIVLTASTIGGPATPSLSVSPANLPFGNVTQNTTSTAQTFTASGENLTGNITYAKNGVDAAAFTITETAWSAATGGILSVVFNPTDVKNYTASIVISSTGAQDQTVTLTGAGVLPPVSDPTHYWDFGTDAANPAPSGTIANLTVSDISIGNTLGTLATFISTGSASSGYMGASAQYNAGNAARAGALNTGASGSAYFEFTVTPNAGYSIALSAMSFGTRSTNTGAAAYSLRSSVDNYATEITGGDIMVTGNPWTLKSNLDLTFETADNSPVTFRLYGYAGTGSPGSGTINWRIDDLSLILSATAISVATPVLSVSPANLAFGDITTDTESAAQTLTVSGENLTGNILYAKEGTDADAFTITETTWAAATGGTLSVVFNPTEVRDYTASIVISSTGAQDKVVALTGAGIAPPVEGQATFYWNFGTSAANPSPTLLETDVDVSVSDISIGNSNGTVAAFLSTGSASSGYAGASGQYNAGNAARTDALNTGASGSAYFEFTVTPDAGYSIALSAISFGTRSTNTGPAAYSLRSSVNNYATEIAGGEITVSGNPWALKSNSGLTFATANNNPVTFRLYGYDGAGNAASGTINWRIDDLSIVLIATAITPPLYSITAESNNENYGTVSLEDNVITAIPTSCLYNYATPAYTVTPAGKAIVTQDGDEFTVTGLEDDVTITINFQVNPDAPAVYTVTLKNKGEIFEELQTVCGEIAIPETTPTACEGWEFIGWAETSVSETTIAPACYHAGDILTPSGSITLYAVYKHIGEIFTASLTQEEIVANNVSGGYSDRSISSESGEWTGQMAITLTPTAYVQINTTGTGGAAGSYILSPEFDGIVSTVKITYADNTAANRRFKIANESGDIVLGTSANTVASTGGSVEVANLDKVAQVNRIKITSEGGAVYITDIDVTYEEEVIYNSNPDCTIYGSRQVVTNEINAYSVGNNIYLSNLPEPANIYVYDVVGRLMVSQKATASNDVVAVAQKGVFVIKIVSGNNIQTVKIINR